MSDKETLARILMQSNDPTPLSNKDVYKERYGSMPFAPWTPTGVPTDYLFADMPEQEFSEYPRLSMSGNILGGLMNSILAAKMLAHAPGPVKIAAGAPAAQAAIGFSEAHKDYQQLQGQLPLQLRQTAWERLMDAAARPTDETQFQRGRFSGER